MSLGRLTPPQSPWEGLRVTNFDQCLHIVLVIGKCTDVSRYDFFGWGKGLRNRGIRWGEISIDEFVMGERKVP